jgi:hypothetical protein
MKRLVTAAVLAAACATVACATHAVARADEYATADGPPSPSEAQFIASIQQDLGARFPRASDAVKAGYILYLPEDEAGTFSYANRQWTSDPKHPSQLWYDKNGYLLGADFSVPRPNHEPRPNLWGINPGRWVEFDGHVHWVTKDPATGEMIYGGALWNHLWVENGGSIADPTADTVVKVGGAKNAADVTAVFELPTIWDLIVWIRPNRFGAFAYRNPDVTP